MTAKKAAPASALGATKKAASQIARSAAARTEKVARSAVTRTEKAARSASTGRYVSAATAAAAAARGSAAAAGPTSRGAAGAHDRPQHEPTSEDLELLGNWLAGPGARPTSEDKQRWARRSADGAVTGRPRTAR